MAPDSDNDAYDTIIRIGQSVGAYADVPPLTHVLAKELESHIFVRPDVERPFGIVPWWPGRVAWKRDAELLINQLAMLPEARRIRWRIIRIETAFSTTYAVVFSG